MNKVLLSTALVAGIMGGAFANKEVTQTALGSAAQFVISDSHAQNANGFARSGSCTYNVRPNFRGRSLTLSYEGANNRTAEPANDFFDRENLRGRLNNNISSIRLSGGAQTVLFDRRNQNRILSGAISFGMATLPEGMDNRASSVICGTSQALEEVTRFN